MSFWDSQRAVDTAGLVDNMAEIGGVLRARREAKREEKQFREGYAKALEEAKRTGVMPVQYQKLAPIDHMGGHIGVKAVALRELGKLNPRHPLVVSPTVRGNIATQTKINYNRANRPDDPDFHEFAPSDPVAQKIYEFTLGK
ncbi:hypothetical protein ACWV27_26095 (plasmid) [Massilia varians]|jgi:hypothetical protein|uniref:hypothetical protein n=1 Tax=Massilia TaxID=149698 RepID=UPI000426394E|nr:hypothetical protein [Massilia alkalitolerans]